MQQAPLLEVGLRDIPAIAALLRAGMEALPGCRRLTIEIPTIFDDESWGLGAITLRQEWILDLADLADPALRR